MARLGLAARLALIVAGGLVLVQMIMAIAYFVDRRDDGESGLASPLIGQVAALVQVLDHVPAAERDLVLRAATAPGFRVEIRPGPPPEGTQTEAMNLLERRLRAQLPETPRRAVSAIWEQPGDTAGRFLPLFTKWRGAYLHVMVGLSDGSMLDAEATGDLTARLLGVPVGFFAGLLGVAVALASVIAVRRETRPLSDLSAALDRFGTSLEAQTVVPRGAPDVRGLILTFDAMQRRIVELVRGRSLVLGALSHDLRTYVTRLHLRLELLPDDPQTARAQSDLREMQTLLDDALSFARGAFVTEGAAPVDLAILVEAECAAHRAQGAPVALAHVPTAPALVIASASALKRVAANLIGNAVAYGGRADVSVVVGGRSVELVVEDRGPGIAPAERGRVFEPFYRLDASRSRDTGGAGLGLTIVQQIVGALKGSVAIEDREGGGARVRVRLPLA